MLRTKWIVNVLRLLWVLLILNNEYAVFLSSAKHCLSALPTVMLLFHDVEIWHVYSIQ